ncbi:TPA: hypothetical protein QDB10_002231 [Burkholderia vietnamiensis]|nr:hypothetical protein [Burkholderia vietnamiensis]
MKNQHKQIKGYRDLSPAEIDAMNEAKELAEKVGAFVRKMESQSSIAIGPVVEVDPRWLAIAKTDLQKGFMSLVRSVARPTTF